MLCLLVTVYHEGGASCLKRVPETTLKDLYRVTNLETLKPQNPKTSRWSIVVQHEEPSVQS
jgi:hypothetical protein